MSKQLDDPFYPKGNEPGKREWKARLNEAVRIVTNMNLDLMKEMELLQRRGKKPVKNAWEFSEHHNAIKDLFRTTLKAEDILRNEANRSALLEYVYPPEKVK